MTTDTPRTDALEREGSIDTSDSWQVSQVSCSIVHSDDCRTIERELTAANEQIAALKEALDDMVRQFAYASNGRRYTGGLSALEHAFAVLGLADPHPLDKEEMCDESGCNEPSTCGTPTPAGYRRTCSDHCPKLDAAIDAAKEGK
jgi:hypothetical protein